MEGVAGEEVSRDVGDWGSRDPYEGGVYIKGEEEWATPRGRRRVRRVWI